MQNKAVKEKDAQPYEKSPIYRVVRDVLRESHAATARMGKSYKFTLGEAIRRYAQEATETVFLAYEERTDIAVKLARIRGIKPAHSGINFVGTIVLPFRNYTRNMTVYSAKEYAKELSRDPFSEQAFDSLNSYVGLMRSANTFNMRKRLCQSVARPMLIGHDEEYTKIFRY